MLATPQHVSQLMPTVPAMCMSLSSWWYGCDVIACPTGQRILRPVVRSILQPCPWVGELEQLHIKSLILKHKAGVLRDWGSHVTKYHKEINKVSCGLSEDLMGFGSLNNLLDINKSY